MMVTVQRTKMSAINSTVGILFAVVNSLLSFVLNAVFIRLLGLEYAGINSLFSSILNLLNIADLGVSNAILFRLYKKIAEGDDNGICLLLTTYKRICYLIAAVIGIGGLCCIPFLPDLVKEVPSFPEPLWALFVIVLSNSVVTHAFDYTSQMLTARQEQYIKTIIQYACKFLVSGLQLLFLFLYKNIYLFLSIALFMSVVQAIVYAIVTKKRYNALWNSKECFNREERVSLLKDTGSLAFYKLCRALDSTIDTLLISKYVSVATTAIYGSVNLIISFLQESFGNINDGMLASVGDLNARGERQQISNVFYQSMHFSFLVFGVIAVVLVPVLSPFVLWWIGYTLSDLCLYMMLLNFIMAVFGNHVAVFRNSLGIFTQGWKRPFFTALFNIVFSVWLIIKLGLLGTLVGTAIARLLTLHWYDPWLVCKYGLGETPFRYYIRFVLYILIVLAISWFVLWINNQLPPIEGLLDIIWHSIVYTVIAVISLIGIGYCFPEQKNLFVRIGTLVREVFENGGE